MDLPIEVKQEKNGWSLEYPILNLEEEKAKRRNYSKGISKIPQHCLLWKTNRKVTTEIEVWSCDWTKTSIWTDARSHLSTRTSTWQSSKSILRWKSREEIYSTLNSPQAALFFFVPKKDGWARPVQDYWYLNKWMVKNAYPLPRIDDLIDKLIGKQLFIKMDIR